MTNKDYDFVISILKTIRKRLREKKNAEALELVEDLLTYLGENED